MAKSQALRKVVEEEVPEGKAAPPKQEEGKEPFYMDSLFWIRVGVGIIFGMVLLFYFFFSG